MSEQFVATASVRIVPDVTGFAAALKAEVETATLAATATSKNTVATRTFAAATGVSTLAVKENAVALETKGAAAAAAAAETRLSAKADREAAVAASQLSRGLTTATASQFGLRGAVLASSGPFLAAVIGIEILSKSVKEASAEQEAMFRIQRILGTELAKSSEEWAKNQEAVGLSTTAALKYEGAIAEVFHNVGLSTEKTAQFSQQLVRLSTDVGAFNHADPSQVLRAFQLGLSGNLRGLRQFVPGVTAARVALRAMADTGKDVKADLTDQELAIARYEVIVEAASNQVGSFNVNQGSLANQAKVLQSTMANLGAEVGATLTPVLVNLAREAELVLKPFAKLAQLFPSVGNDAQESAKKVGFWNEAFHTFARDITFPLLGFKDIFDHIFGDSVPAATVATQGLVGAFNEFRDPIRFDTEGLTVLGQVFGSVEQAFDRAAAKFRQGLELQIRVTTTQLDTAQLGLLKEQAAGAPITTRLGAAQNVLDKAAAVVAAAQTKVDALSGVGSATAKKQLKDALQKEISARGEVEGLQGQIDAKAKAAAAAAKAAAAAAKAAAEAARRAHDEAIQNANTELQFTVDLAHLKAQRTASLVDDLAADKVELHIINQKIENAKKILDATTREQALEQLTLDKERARQQVATDRAAQLQRQKDHRDLIRSRTEQRLQLDIEIASTNKNINAEIAAREARIRFDTIQRNNVKGDIVRRKQLTLEIAQDTQAIKDLKKATNENLSAQAQFQFLTTEAGFVANLLGNLIPRGSTAGLVGGTAGAISTATAGVGPQISGGTGIGHPSSALSAAAQTAGGPRGASTGQMATLIHVQMQMLQAILRLTGQRAHPEAAYQRYTAADDLNVATST